MAISTNQSTPRPAAATAASPRPTGGLSAYALCEDEVKYRLVANVYGRWKSGKNHLCFTAPGPISIQSFDEGLEGVVEKFNKNKKIHKAVYELQNQPGEANREAVQKEAERLWDKFVDDYMDAIHSTSIRTHIIDQGTEVWELLRLANWGQLTANSQHYSKINPIFRRLIRAAMDTDKNVLFIHKMKEEWKEGAGGKQSKTGAWELAGMKEVPYLVQVNIQCWREDGLAVPDCFHGLITDCRQNPEVNGMDLSGEMLTFPQIGQLIFPDSDIAHWE